MRAFPQISLIKSNTIPEFKVKMTKEHHKVFPALVVSQWLRNWDKVRFDESAKRGKPEPRFYLLSIPAQELRRLSEIHRREATVPRAEDEAIQRGHAPERSREIRQFLKGGFPWSDLSASKRESDEFSDLLMPGWLPTAIVANILSPGQRGIDSADVLDVVTIDESRAEIRIPLAYQQHDWKPSVPPLEIIDGQHRLLAFDDTTELEGDFELPVVAFHGLDITWQAYLFYMINIKPKRINPSLAFDLYPILRVQDWLEKAPERATIYRDTRAQELTEVLWAHPESPWKGRINMLGETGPSGAVTQAAFIRSLTASYIKRASGTRIGGLFGEELHLLKQDVLQWTRAQQAAFLLLVWKEVAEAAKNTLQPWAESLRLQVPQSELQFENQAGDPAFVSRSSLLATDQGVRGILQVTNDMCYVAAEELRLSEWRERDVLEHETLMLEDVTDDLRTLETLPVASFLKSLAGALMSFDWRTASAADLTEEQRRAQLVFRGSSGYKELRRQLVQTLLMTEDPRVLRNASLIRNHLGY